MLAARLAGVSDTSSFKSRMVSPEVQLQIQDDIALGRSLEVRGIPTLFVNGTKIVGDDAAILERVVKDELRKGSS